MQQKCAKDLAVLLEGLIDDLLNDLGPEDAVNYLELVIIEAKNASTIRALPTPIARQLLKYAKDGMTEGKQGAPRKSAVKELLRTIAATLIRERKAELRAEGKKATGNNSAEDLALAEVQRWLADLGIAYSIGYLRRLAQSDN